MLERFDFNYDPMRQGYDTNTWRTLLGAPAVSGAGRLVVDNGTGISGSTIHYTDFVKGTINFNVNIPTSPAEGDSRYFGMSSPSNNRFVRFSTGSELKCETSDGGNATVSDEIEWNAADWNGNDLDFQIVWEPGMVRFFIEGTNVYTVTDNSIPYGPLSLYLFDNSTSPMTIGAISVRGTQSVYINPKTSDSSSTIDTGTLSLREVVTVTEDMDILLPSLTVLPTEEATVAEDITLTVVSP